MKKLSISMVATLVVLLSACSGGDDDDDEVARVDDLTFDDTAVRIGDSVQLDVDFTFARKKVDDDDRNVIIKIAIPNGLRYETNSARVDKIADDDEVDPETQDLCDDGSWIVTFNLDEADLRNVDDPAGDADGTLKLNLIGTNAIGSVNVEARAGYDVVAGSCADGLVPEAVAVLIVTP